MMMGKRGSYLGICLLVSVLIHAGFILLPAGLFEPLLSYRTIPAASYRKDLTPDFALIAITVVKTAEVSLPVPTVTDSPLRPTAERGPDLEPMPQPSPPGDDKAGDTPKEAAGGASASHSQAVLFPPLPRLIIPPRLEDLDVGTLTVNLRILVGKSGEPEMVVLGDSINSEQIRAAILESARKFRFEPARRGNEPVAAWIEIPINLEASGGR